MYDEKMAPVRSAGLPGFYTDNTGRYGITVYSRKRGGTLYICCFINDNGEYDVTVDGLDEYGVFANNVEWESYNDAKNAVKALCVFVKKYGGDKNA